MNLRLLLPPSSLEEVEVKEAEDEDATSAIFGMKMDVFVCCSSVFFMSVSESFFNRIY